MAIFFRFTICITIYLYKFLYTACKMSADKFSVLFNAEEVLDKQNKNFDDILKALQDQDFTLSPYLFSRLVKSVGGSILYIGQAITLTCFWRCQDDAVPLKFCFFLVL